MIGRCPLGSSEFKKKITTYKLYSLQGTPGGTCQSWGQKRYRVQGLGFWFLGGWEGTGDSWALIGELKHKSGNLKCEKRQNLVAQMVSYKNQPNSLKQRHLNGGQGWGVLDSSSSMPGNVFILDSLPWSGCLANQDSSQALALQMEKPSARADVNKPTGCQSDRSTHIQWQQ